LERRTFADESFELFSPVMVQGLVDTGSGEGTFGNPSPLFAPADAVGTYTDPLDRTTSITTDRFGLPLSILNAEGTLTTYVRNNDGTTASVTRQDPDNAGPLGNP
jgi:YD repeat-containing protein